MMHLPRPHRASYAVRTPHHAPAVRMPCTYHAYALTLPCHAFCRQGRANARVAARDAARCRGRGNGSRPASANAARRERATPPPRQAASRPTSATGGGTQRQERWSPRSLGEGPWAQPVMGGVREACSPSRADELQSSTVGFGHRADELISSTATGFGRPLSAPPLGRGAEARAGAPGRAAGAGGRQVYRPKQPAAGALRPTSASNRYIVGPP